MSRSSLHRWGVLLALAAWLAAGAGEALAQQRGGGTGRTGTAAARTGTAARSTGSSGGARGYVNSTMVGEASVTSDPETRRLIIVTDDDTWENVSQVISNLDRPKPQVLIKVVFLEATYRDGSDIGVEGTFRKTIDGDNTQMNVLQQFNGLPGLNSGNGIFNVVGENYTATLRLIAEAGKLEVLSRPSILARNNQQAQIVVGQQVPLITGTRYDTFGNQINTIQYQNVGIILRVTPFITSDGMVEMIVIPEISNLSDQTVAISTGTNAVGAPVINTRSADTVVVTPDGQTVVIGGLLQNSKTEAQSKVPVLGDLPLLGAAFRRTVKQDTKTELLIFLTPHIIMNPVDLAGLTTRERANSALAPRAFPNQELDRFLDGLPMKSDAPPPKKSRK